MRVSGDERIPVPTFRDLFNSPRVTMFYNSPEGVPMYVFLEVLAQECEAANNLMESISDAVRAVKARGEGTDVERTKQAWRETWDMVLAEMSELPMDVAIDGLCILLSQAFTRIQLMSSNLAPVFMLQEVDAPTDDEVKNGH